MEYASLTMVLLQVVWLLTVSATYWGIELGWVLVMFEEPRETHNFGYGDNACVPVQLLSRMESLKFLSAKQP